MISTSTSVMIMKMIMIMMTSRQQPLLLLYFNDFGWKKVSKSISFSMLFVVGYYFLMLFTVFFGKNLIVRKTPDKRTVKSFEEPELEDQFFKRI